MVFIIWAVLLLIASALLADAMVYYDDTRFCEVLDEIDAKEQCEHVIVGTVGQKLQKLVEKGLDFTTAHWLSDGLGPIE